MKNGDSYNLTCSANCTEFNSSEISWFKDDVKLQETGSELLLTSVTYVNSGNYTCGWRGGGHRSNAFKLDAVGHLASDDQNKDLEEEDDDLQYAAVSLKPKLTPNR
ncbi:hypothetical protein ACEWY4_020193 [Coilia grayii]|uniref:Ig-like domain-containing protein n=1 Tax=Coilia grayii TaxID=363190 RepID=A0ABD1JE73_9TELE